MAIEIINQQKRIPLKTLPIKKTVQKILKILKVSDANLSIAFVTDQKIKFLNKKFLNRDHTTDVIAFDYARHQKPDTRHKRIDGEIVISVTTAFRNAKRFNTTPKNELALYAIHGILHLLGYNDHSATDKKKMRKKEQELMKQI